MSEIQVGQINSTDGSTAITTGADGYVSFAKTQIGGRRNLIINGAMQVWQRGDFSVSDRGYFADRWKDYFNPGTSASQLTSGLPDGFSSGVSYESDTATVLRFEQRIEGDTSTILNNKQATFSFYVKGSTSLDGVTVNATLGVASTKDDFSTVTVVANGSFMALSESWQRYEATLDLTGVDVSNGLSARIATGNCTVGSILYITGVQLEVGSVATPFEHRSYGEELAACFRYYFRMHPTGNYTRYADGYWTNANNASVNVYFPVPMRANPEIDTTGVANDYIIINGGSVYNLTSLPTFNRGTQTADGSCIFANILATSTSNGTAGNATQLASLAGGNWVGDFLGFQAEL